MGLPYMVSDQHDDDALFLVFEEDWRLHFQMEIDLASTDSRQPAVTPLTGRLDDKCQGQRFFADDRRMLGPGGPGVAKAGSKFVGDYASVKAGSGEVPRGSSLDGLVATCLAAAKSGRGDLVWITWQPGQGEVKHPNRLLSGAMLIAVSRAGARAIKTAVDDGTIPDGHWDVKLREWLKANADTFLWSYLTPPAGNYFAHLSGCEGAFAKEERPHCFGASWACEGIWPREDDQKREKWLAFARTKGGMEWVRALDIEALSEHLVWKTYWGIEGQRPGMEQLDKAKHTKRGDCYWKEESTDREARTRRALTRRWKFRNWVDTPHEVSFSSVIVKKKGLQKKPKACQTET